MELKVISQGGQSNLTLGKNETSMLEASHKDVNEDKTVELKDINKSEKNNSSKDELNKAMDKLNRFLEDEKKHAEYAVHDELNRVMIKIVDDDTDKVLMEVPPEKILDAVAMMCKAAGLLVDKKA